MKRIIKSVILFAVTLAVALSTFSCAPRQRKFNDTCFGIFDSFATLTVYTASQERYTEYNKIFRDTAERMHRLLDAFDEYDGVVNICTLNLYSGETAIEVSDELYSFLEHAASLSETSLGYTSLTVGALTAVWKEAISEKAVPSSEALEEAAKHISADALVLDSNAHTVFFKDKLLKLDVGAFAKGYAAEITAHRLIDAGCDSFLLNFGGTLVAHGQKNNGESWHGGIKSPDGRSDLNISVDISGKAMSTSGSYLRGFKLDGVRYHHIINPFTYTPENRFTSVTVVCTSAATADMLSTALFSMTREMGEELASAHHAEAVWIYADGTVTATDGINISE